MPSGRTILVNEVHSLNAAPPMEANSEENVISAKDVQL